MKDRFLPSFSSFSSLHDWGTHFHLHCCSILRKPLSDVNANNSLLIARHSTLSGRSSFVLRHKLFCSAESPCQTNLTPQPIQPSCIPLLEYPLLIALWLCWLKVRRIAQYPICANCSEGYQGASVLIQRLSSPLQKHPTAIKESVTSNLVP